MENNTRLKQRFSNFKRAFILLQEGVELKNKRELSQLEKEGIVQRFEYTLELAWLVMRDYLESQNFVLEFTTPRSVIKKSFEVQLINSGEVWQDALDMRNKMSHTYDSQEFEKAVEQIAQEYLAVFSDFYEKILSIIMSDNQ